MSEISLYHEGKIYICFNLDAAKDSGILYTDKGFKIYEG